MLVWIAVRDHGHASATPVTGYLFLRRFLGHALSFGFYQRERAELIAFAISIGSGALLGDLVSRV